MAKSFNVFGILVLLVGLSAKAGPSSSGCADLILTTDNQAESPLVDRAWIERLVGSSDLDFVELDVSPNPVHISRLAQISVPRQRESHLKLRGDLRAQSSTVLGVKKMFYPASGVDSATPFMILPGLRVVVGLDENLFANRSRKQPIKPDFGPGDAMRGFTWVGNFKSYPDISDLLVGRLMAHIPNVRIRQVIAFGPSKQNRVANHVFLPHGLILFDQGERTPLRSYIHLAEPTSSGAFRPRGSTSLLQRVVQEPFDALLRKAAMEFFTSTETQAEVRQLLLNLISNDGLWIDGDSIEKSGENSSFRSRNLNQLLAGLGIPLRFPLTQTEIEGFGYGHVEFVRLSSAKPRSRDASP